MTDPLEVLGAQEALRLALASRAAVDEGRYCNCDDPKLRGVALMCFRCNLRNKDQELARIHLMIDSHDFHPKDPTDEFWREWCVFCMRPKDHPRHMGNPANGETTWGETVTGVVGDPETYRNALFGGTA